MEFSRESHYYAVFLKKTKCNLENEGRTKHPSLSKSMDAVTGCSTVGRTMIEKCRLFFRRLIRKSTLLYFRASIGRMVRNRRRSKMSLFISSAEEIAYTLKHTQVLSSCPIWGGENENFEFLIPAKDGHIEFLNKNLENLADKYGNQIKVNILINRHAQKLVKIPSLLIGRVSVVAEDSFDKELSYLRPFIARFNESRWSWFRQQCLKTLFVSNSAYPVVILDADTLLAKPINFKPSGKNLLLMGSDAHSHFHPPYSIHIKKYLGINPLPINFTQHCQLQEPKVIREIYSENVVKGLSEWLEKGRSPFEFSPVCEYQTYAEFARKNYPTQTILYSQTHHLSFLSTQLTSSSVPNLLDVDKHLLGECEEDCDVVTMLG